MSIPGIPTVNLDKIEKELLEPEPIALDYLSQSLPCYLKYYVSSNKSSICRNHLLM